MIWMIEKSSKLILNGYLVVNVVRITPAIISFALALKSSDPLGQRVRPSTVPPPVAPPLPIPRPPIHPQIRPATPQPTSKHPKIKFRISFSKPKSAFSKSFVKPNFKFIKSFVKPNIEFIKFHCTSASHNDLCVFHTGSNLINTQI